MEVVNPSVMVSRLDLVVLDSAVFLELIFVDSPRVYGILGYLESKEAVRDATEVGTTHQGASRWVVPPSGTPLVHLWPILCVLAQ